ncbi:TonB-dependent receptor plug domain-containing protein [Algoriphagus aestuarii]|nr:TonB-dependent receptor plug domain-containing protein [Algoriphagus aestuarii]
MRKNHLGFLFIGLAVSLIIFSFTSYNDPLKKIIESFEENLSKNPIEKVYVHLDRSYYAPGETIWFKSYLTAGPFHQPSSLSTTIYVELIDTETEIIQHHKLFSPDGFASGHINLPDTLSNGNYLLRAYTNWMRNSGEEYFFHKQFTIVNGLEHDQNGEITEDIVDLQFFPEGGNLVDGLMNKVAFKAIGEDGLSRKVTGEILEDGIVIKEFESTHLGMGIFAFIPKRGEIYQAWIEETGQTVNLPQALESGILLSVTNSSKSNDLLIKVQSSENTELKQVLLLAQTRGLIGATSQIDISNKIAFAKIPKKEFPSGINQITLMDEMGTPLAERLVFIDHQDQLHISLKTNNKSYAPRDSVHLDIEAKDQDGNPVIATFSLNIVDGGQIYLDKNGETIQSYFLMSSELKGNIESPGYYFNPENRNREEAMDLLMMTQGWRRFTILEALEGNIPNPEYPIEKGIMVKGKLLDKNQNPLAEGSVSYLSLFPFPDSKTAQTTENGSFELTNLVFYDTTNLVLQGKSENGKTGLILLDTNYLSPKISNSSLLFNSDNAVLPTSFFSESELRKNSNKAFDLDSSDYLLDGVEVKGKKIEPNYTGPKIYGEGSVKIQVAGNPGLENQQHPLELVRGRVPGVQVSGNGVDWKVLIQGYGSIKNGTDPLIMIDDIPIDIKSLITIPVQDIESYTVWKGPDTAVFGSRGANGAIGFYTKKRIARANLAKQESQNSLVKGYQVQKEFYSPAYPVQNRNNPKPDRRATLFWVPFIQTDSLGKASVSFYNHDIETEVFGQIEGLSSQGQIGVGRFSYTIEK